MTYVIKSYKEEFLEAQERIGREVTKDWKQFGQTSAEQLKQIYSQPGFDPETRHYCFKNGELIGFLTSAVLESDEEPRKANLEFPMVLPDHEEAETLLFEKALDVLRKKGVKVVRTRVSEAWGNTVEMAQRWGYAPAEELGVGYTIGVDTTDIKGVPEFGNIEGYNHDQDFEQMVDIFVRDYNMTPEQARSNFETLEKAGDLVVAHIVIRKDGTIIGRALALRDEDDPTRAFTGAIYVTEKQQRVLFLKKILKICKEKGIKRLDAAVFGDLLKIKDQLAEQFESLGFQYVTAISYYEKEI